MLRSKQHSRGFPCSTCTTAGAGIVPNRHAYCHERTQHHRRSIKFSISYPKQLQYRPYGQPVPTRTAAAVQSCRRSARTRSTAVAPRAYLHSDPSDSSSSGQSVPGQLRVLVVGANPVGLAAAVALAQQAGCAVEVHDSRADPREDKHADNNSTLVALGKRGLDALSHINLPPPSSGGRAVATITTGSSPTPNSNAANSTSTNTPGIAGVWGPGSANLGVPPTPVGGGTASSTSGSAGAKAAGQGLSEMTELSSEPLPGLTLLQGMVVMGAGAARREEYSRPASRSKPKSEGAALTGGMTAGVAAIDELNLTTRLLAAAAAIASTTASASQQSQQPQLVLPGAQAASGAAGTLNSRLTNNLSQGPKPNPTGPVLTPKGTTAIPQGPSSAPSAEAAQEAALPPVVPTPGTGSNLPMGADILTRGGLGSQSEDVGSVGVEVHYNSHLTLFDAANKQATFMGPGGAATIVPYDICIAADASGGGHLVTSALQELQDRQAAHRHPSAAHHSSSSSAGATGVSELEYRAWHDMPQDPGLAAVLGAAASTTSSTGPGVSSTTPQQGWLLVWTGPGNVQAAHPGLSSAGSNTAIIPGAPTCTVMAWPSKGGATWSGCVFTHPQVFEALRSQSEYEQFLGSVSAPTGSNGNVAKLPALWVQGIAAQLKRNDRVGSVPAAVTPPPHSLSAPSAGLVALSTAAVPSNSPQLLNPGISLGLAEASSLAAALSAQLQRGAPGKMAGNRAGADAVTESAEGLRKAVQEGLKQFDAQHGPEAQALHKLTAQLSWLRHPFSPAARAAAASVPFGTLAWIFTALGAPRTGLALQWKCLLAVLPIVAAVQRVLLYKLGLGRPDTVAAARSSRGGLDASYRKPAAVGASTSLDSGVHVTESAQAQKESAALNALAGFNNQTPVSDQEGSDNPAYSLSGVADAVEPCGKSFLSFLHTTDMPPTGIWRLLQVAPLIVSVLWGALFWAAGQAIKWGIWAYRAWGWAQSGIA